MEIKTLIALPHFIVLLQTCEITTNGFDAITVIETIIATIDLPTVIFNEIEKY